ncbi:hypothetical protein MFRU_043g00270 [Monilinia fructicola]|nr:hypothetical protein MFRU_043g00270 [Monilinia fructicola]
MWPRMFYSTDLLLNALTWLMSSYRDVLVENIEGQAMEDVDCPPPGQLEKLSISFYQRIDFFPYATCIEFSMLFMILRGER